MKPLHIAGAAIALALVLNGVPSPKLWIPATLGGFLGALVFYRDLEWAIFAAKYAFFGTLFVAVGYVLLVLAGDKVDRMDLEPHQVPVQQDPPRTETSQEKEFQRFVREETAKRLERYRLWCEEHRRITESTPLKEPEVRRAIPVK
jgi:hypothetical protein